MERQPTFDEIEPEIFIYLQEISDTCREIVGGLSSRPKRIIGHYPSFLACSNPALLDTSLRGLRADLAFLSSEIQENQLQFVEMGKVQELTLAHIDQLKVKWPTVKYGSHVVKCFPKEQTLHAVVCYLLSERAKGEERLEAPSVAKKLGLSSDSLRPQRLLKVDQYPEHKGLIEFERGKRPQPNIIRLSSKVFAD